MHCAQQKTKRIYQLLWKNEPQKHSFSEEGPKCCHKNSITPRYSSSISNGNYIVQIILCANGYQESRKCFCCYCLFRVFKLPKCVRKLNSPPCSLILHLEIQSHICLYFKYPCLVYWFQCSPKSQITKRLCYEVFQLLTTDQGTTEFSSAAG